ncbi:response regulator [Paenibacillus sp. GYB004]|uniref:response regulator transcription factor n=1 Tax=Paenibacillus sp. GYB004 TaxID=2994393 RepID=UPI002F966068
MGCELYQILIAEDEVWIRDALVEMVDKLSPKFSIAGEASNGEEAWTLVQEHWPNVLITDIMMPKKTGLWLCEQIHELKLPVIPIIISGYDSFQYAKQAMRYGVSEYLLKPVEESELHDALNRSVKRLENISDIREGVVKINEFMQQLPQFDSSAIFHHMNKLIDQLYTIHSKSMDKKSPLFTILGGKLSEMLQIHEPGLIGSSLPDNVEDVKKVFFRLVEKWRDYSSQDVKQQIRKSIQKVCGFIQTQYFQNITLEQMAQMAHLSISHFSAVFKQETGQSLIHYLNEVRIQKSKQLLLEPDIKIYQVAELVGYTSMSYFNRMFKKTVGKTPAEYRKIMGL